MSHLEWVIFFVFSCSMNIIAFNLLISLVSNTFDKVMTILPAIQTKAKADILIEINSAFISSSKNQEPKYLYIAKYTSQIKAENNEEWSGKTQVITQKIDQIQSQIYDLKHHNTSVQQELNGVKDQLKAQNTDFKMEIKEQI